MSIVTDKGITEGDLVIVIWIDTEDDCSWNTVKQIRTYQPPLAKHVGWFLNEDTLCVRILAGVCGNQSDIDELAAGYSMIPKRSIIAIEKVQDDEIEIPVPESINED